MVKKECCRNCAHCVSAQSSDFSWCKLRKLKLHPEISLVFFCHHWTQLEPALPDLHNHSDLKLDRQLDFEKVVLVNES